MQPAAERLHERPHDPQPETKPLETLIGLPGVTGAPLEEAAQHVGRDARPVIAHDHEVTAAPDLQADVDVAACSVMHRIAEQIREHPLDGSSMRAYGRGQRSTQVHSALRLMQESCVVGDDAAHHVREVYELEPRQLDAWAPSPMAALEDIVAEIVGSRDCSVEPLQKLAGADDVTTLAPNPRELGDGLHRSEGAPNVVDEAVDEGLESSDIRRIGACRALHRAPAAWRIDGSAPIPREQQLAYENAFTDVLH